VQDALQRFVRRVFNDLGAYYSRHMAEFAMQASADPRNN
jgi:hypothetical protein